MNTLLKDRPRNAVRVSMPDWVKPIVPDAGAFFSALALVDMEGGWFWWTCLPGCLPDSCAFGPFASHAEALADAMENAGN